MFWIRERETSGFVCLHIGALSPLRSTGCRALSSPSAVSTISSRRPSQRYGTRLCSPATEHFYPHAAQQRRTYMLPVCNYPSVASLIWIAVRTACASQLQSKTCPSLRMGQANSGGTQGCVCLLSASDSRHTQLTERRIRGLLLSAVSLPCPQHQPGTSSHLADSSM